MNLKQIGKLFKRGGKKGRKRGEKGTKRGEKEGEKNMGKKREMESKKKLPLRFWEALQIRHGTAFKIDGTICTPCHNLTKVGR